MKTSISIVLSLLTTLVMSQFGTAQDMKLSRVLLISSPEWKEGADRATFEEIFAKKITGTSIPGVKLNLYRSDRGQRNGAYLMAWETDDPTRLHSITAEGHPFSDKTISKMTSTKVKPSSFLESQGRWTCYELVGGDKIDDMPPAGLLGIHYIQIRPDKKEAFEEFIVNKLHKSLSIPGMRLMYYKAIDGEDEGSYITIYAIASFDARERYWPTGAPETQELKDLFRPYKPLAQELKPFLVKDSYLKEDTGAGAAIFESLVWTDYLIVSD